MCEDRYKPYLLIISIAFVAIFSFYLGRKSVDEKEVVIYEKGETVYRSIPANYLDLKAELKGDVRLLPYHFLKPDTIFIDSIEYVVQSIDTAEIVSDFIKLREYQFAMRDNELGKIIVRPSVQYNRLVAFDYEETPITKIIESRRSRVFVPFVSAGVNIININSGIGDGINVGGGMFYHNLGVQYQYNINNNLKYSTLNLLYKF